MYIPNLLPFHSTFLISWNYSKKICKDQVYLLYFLFFTRIVKKIKRSHFMITLQKAGVREEFNFMKSL